MSTVLDVSLREVAVSRSLRLDPHVYLLRKFIEPFVLKLPRTTSVPLDTSVLTGIANGLNLPEKAYQQPQEETELLYISVGALSHFALRPTRGVYLRDPGEYEYRSDLTKTRTNPTDVLVTRSGTPGIAWPGMAWTSDAPSLIPSGFLIRLVLEDGGPIRPSFLAAVLNHPIWRLWTSSLAAGKRQRNLTQDHLGEVFVPLPSDAVQERIGETYLKALDAISGLLEKTETLRTVCDKILREKTDLVFASLKLSTLTFDEVPVAGLWGSGGLRIDSRYHRQEVRAVVDALKSTNTIELGSLLDAPPIRGRQPEMLALEDPAIESRVVATVAVQNGQVVRELTKPTTLEALENAGMRELRKGDLLLAMDGEGSIGKAATFDGSYRAVTDSHVGILRLNKPAQASALSCYLNSSLGQAQVELAISGATGQTQLAGADVERMLVPTALLAQSSEVKNAFGGALGVYEAKTKRVRRSLCEAESSISDVLIGSGCLGESASFMGAHSTPSELLSLLALLKPEMF